jgi:ribosomal protein L11 methyltransferase
VRAYVAAVRLLVVTVPRDEVELAAGELWALGIGGLEERDGPGPGVVDLVVDGDPTALAAAVGDRWPTRLVEVDPDAWVEGWRPWARAVLVADGVSVRPPWVASLGTELEVVIDPERAWGHGAHPTTVLCVGWCARRRPMPPTVLDVGCGSGTVAVAAALLGAVDVVALDVDPEALVATRANAVANGVSDVVHTTDLPVGELDRVFDLVVANIGSATLRQLAGDLAPRVAPGGTLLLSGFFPEDVELVAAAYPALGVRSVTERDGWALVELTWPG